MRSEYAELIFSKPIDRWDEALPLGNGMLGCLVWGDGEPLRFSLDRGDLWDSRVAPETEAPSYTYARLIELVKERNQEAIVREFDDFYFRPSPTKLPAGRIELRFGRAAERASFRLSLREAAAEVKLAFAEGESVVRSFLHAERHVGMIAVAGTAADVAIVPPAYTDAEAGQAAEGMGEFEITKVSSLGFPAPELSEDGDCAVYRQRTCTALEYAIVVARRAAGDGGMTIAYTIATNATGAGWLDDAKRLVRDALAGGYEAMEASHRAWWERFWSKSGVSLPDEVCERNWYVTNYLFGSCSRKGAPPMPLQGVWTADEGLLPPWKGDYHNDLNTQLSYWHYLKANHLEEGESFLDYLWELRPAAAAFARSFFDAPGICLPGVMTLDGRSIGGWPMYANQITGQIWLCQAFDHYWLHTGDTGFLRDKAYVYFKETAACIMRWLSPGDDGLLRLPVSSSPEIHDNSLASWLTPNSNYDAALLHYLFETLARMAVELGEEAEAADWRRTRARLPELAVNGRHVLRVSPDEDLRESHRHFSHCMAIYPLLLLDPDRSERERAIVDATILDLERLGKGMWTGYSFAWMACMYARQGNGEGAFHHIRMMWDHFCLPNGFHINGDYKRAGLSFFHYRPFTLEGNMAAANALQEMLLRSDNDVVHVFPAMPEAWRASRVAFDRFRGCKGLLVSAEWSDAELRHVTLEAERDVRFRLKSGWSAGRLALDEGGTIRTVACEPGGALELALAAGGRCRVAAAQV